MNKISKKIVALATMAAFVLTLVPAAAFAATPSSVDTGKSSVQTEEKNTEVNIGDGVNYKLNLVNESGVGLDDQEVYIWVEDTEGNVIDDVDYYNYADKTGPNSTAVEYLGKDKVFHTTKSDNGAWRSLVINVDGDYIIKAGVVKDADVVLDSVDPLKELDSDKVTEWNTVKVNVPDVAKIVLTDKSGDALPNWDANNGTTLDLTLEEHLDGFIANGSDRYTLHGTAYADEAGSKVVANEIFTVTSLKNGIVEFRGDADPETEGYQVKTDANGQFEIVFSMNPFVNDNLTITGDDVNYTVRIIAEKTSAYNINRTQENGYVLAGSDFSKNGNNRLFTDAVQFEILDEKGNAVTGAEAIANEPASNTDTVTVQEHAQYVDILEWPEKSKIEPADIALAWDEAQGVYTLKYNGSINDVADVLVPGKYTVRVSLLSKDNATVSFNVAEFGKVQDLEVALTAKDRSSQRTVALSDEITLGQNVTAEAKYVDENGLKIWASGVTIAATGEALVDHMTSQTGEMVFATRDDVASNDSLLGTTVTVMAWNTANKQYVERELTVVDSYNAFTLAFDPEEGPVNEDNKVNVTVVDEDGDRAQVNGTLEAFVYDQSNEDAKITVETSGTVSNGKGSLTIYSTEETTAKIRVIVKDSTNDGAYAATLDYTVGKEDPLANRSVVMTIGSTDYVVNNNIVSGDAAPYVDSNWRTMVPIRALMEAFDAEVVWDEANPDVVTVNYDGGTQIVMNVDDETYTINGEEGTMDTVPVNNNGRVYVPVRFVAEGIGFTVTALQDAETGLTASVVFQK